VAVLCAVIHALTVVYIQCLGDKLSKPYPSKKPFLFPVTVRPPFVLWLICVFVSFFSYV
jgi:hypothetical protein